MEKGQAGGRVTSVGDFWCAGNVSFLDVGYTGVFTL